MSTIWFIMTALCFQNGIKASKYKLYLKIKAGCAVSVSKRYKPQCMEPTIALSYRMVVYKGADVTEYKIKQLSKNGFLDDYKVLHFATHGLVVPEIPELSAIVLSLFRNEKNNEDGYLNMKEIAMLEIKADFVNLSACETGLGKIYGGEGVVGLTQSFLIAGANGLSVSLWQVADESTM
jgi:CHAT domain-containing protein